MAAQSLRVATYNAELSARGPGLTLQSITKDTDPKHRAVAAVIAAIDADVLLITGIDYDLRGETLAALASHIAGAPYPYQLALRPNAGVATNLDLDGNGKFGEPRDAMAYGRFAGQAGMAILSRLPIKRDEIRDFTEFLWADLPENIRPAETPATQRLSTSGHYEVPIELPDGRSLRLLAYYATPPVFDGPEDRNGRRNHDETAFWLRLIEGKLDVPAPVPPFIVLGQSNLDPMDGEGRADAALALMHHPGLFDPEPRGTSFRKDIGQQGDPRLDTALYDKIGGLRVELVLPSADITVVSAGVLWPPQTDPFSKTLATASRHHPVWVEIRP